MGETVVPLHDDTRSQHSPPHLKRHLLDPQSVQAALPYIDAALAALAGVPKVGPVAQALRVVTGAGLRAITDDRRTIMKRMKLTYEQMKRLDPKADAREIRALRIQLDVCMEMLLEQES
jgi:hypothetical protein